MKRHSLMDTVSWNFPPFLEKHHRCSTNSCHLSSIMGRHSSPSFPQINSNPTRCARKIEMGWSCSVPRTEPGGPRGCGTQGRTQPGWSLTFRPGDNIQNVCQNPRTPIYLSDIYPETVRDSLSKTFSELYQRPSQFLPGNFLKKILSYLFSAALGLHCDAPAPHCGGFSLQSTDWVRGPQ